MPHSNPTVEVVTLIDRYSGEIDTQLISPLAGGNEPCELFIEAGTANWVLFYADEYNDEKLRDRRNSDNMISPFDSSRRLVYAGLVRGAVNFDSTRHLEVGRTTFRPAIVST